MKRLFLIIILSITLASITYSQNNILEFGNKYFEKTSINNENKIFEISISTKELVLNFLVISILFFISTIFYKNYKQIFTIFEALFDFKKVKFIINQKNYQIDNLLNVFNIAYFIIISSVFFYGIYYLKILNIKTIYVIILLFNLFSIIKFIFSNHLSLLKKHFFQYYYKISKITNTINLLFLTIFGFLMIYLPYEHISFSIKIYIFIMLVVSIIGRIQIIFKIADDIFLKLYFILYLCTLEILPLIIGFKLLTKYISVV